MSSNLKMIFKVDRMAYKVEFQVALLVELCWTHRAQELWFFATLKLLVAP